MGLRIIDKQLRRSGRISEAERLKLLELETRRWSGVKGDVDSQSQHEFINNFNRVKACLDSPATMVAKAARIRDDILGRRSGAAATYLKVDVATLLELLANRAED